jgi:hypothetical protein
MNDSAKLLAALRSGSLKGNLPSATVKLSPGEHRHTTYKADGTPGRIGTAVVFVGNDGTGVYVNQRGEMIELDAKQVAGKAAYHNYFVPGSAPVPEAPVAEAPVVPSARKAVAATKPVTLTKS